MKRLIFTILIISLFVGTAIAKDIGPLTYADSNVENDTLRFVELQYTSGSGSLVGKWLYCASTTDLASPMFEACLIQKYTYTTGLCIVDTASSADIGFSANGTAGDIFWVLDNPPANALIRRGLTATKVATGVDPLDYMLYLTNSADSADVAAEFIRSFIEDIESDCDTTELTVQQIMGLIDTEVPALQTDLNELPDAWQVYVSAPVTMPNTDTTDTQVGLVADSVCWAEYIELVITTPIANVTPTNVQLLLYTIAGPVITSLNADTDWDNVAAGIRYIVDLDNFGAALSKAPVGGTIADPSSVCRVPLPVGSYFRLETGEASTSGAFQLRVVYRSNGGSLTTP
jgi:hypothetical protein